MPNRWIEFVKDYSKRHNISYPSAVASPKCKAEYNKAFSKVSKKSGAGCGTSKVAPHCPPTHHRRKSSSSSDSSGRKLSDVSLNTGSHINSEISSSSGVNSEISSQVGSDIIGENVKTKKGKGRKKGGVRTNEVVPTEVILSYRNLINNCINQFQNLPNFTDFINQNEGMNMNFSILRNLMESLTQDLTLTPDELQTTTQEVNELISNMMSEYHAYIEVRETVREPRDKRRKKGKGRENGKSDKNENEAPLPPINDIRDTIRRISDIYTNLQDRAVELGILYNRNVSHLFSDAIENIDAIRVDFGRNRLTSTNLQNRLNRIESLFEEIIKKIQEN